MSSSGNPSPSAPSEDHEIHVTLHSPLDGLFAAVPDLPITAYFMFKGAFQPGEGLRHLLPDIVQGSGESLC